MTFVERATTVTISPRLASRLEIPVAQHGGQVDGARAALCTLAGQANPGSDVGDLRGRELLVVNVDDCKRWGIGTYFIRTIAPGKNNFKYTAWYDGERDGRAVGVDDPASYERDHAASAGARARGKTSV